MRFRTRLGIGYAVLVIVTLAVGITATVMLHSANARLEQVGEELTPNLLAIERLRLEAQQVVSAGRGHLLTGDATTYTNYLHAVGEFQNQLVRVDALGDARALDAAANAYIVASRQAADLRAKEPNPDEILPIFEHTVIPAEHRFEDALAQVESREQARFKRATDQARRYAAASQGMIAVATCFAALVGVALAFMSTRRLGAQYAREQDATAAARRAIAERDDLVAVVSHDLRNPLTTIVLGSNLLDETVTDPRSRKHVTAIGNASRRMQSLIDELLDVSKLEHGGFELHREPCPVESLFETTISLFQTRANDASVTLTTSGAGGLAFIADRERVLQVLSNLVGNALKFTPAGGSIALRARREGDAVRLEVSDTGPGIAPDQRGHLFERYWQGKRRGRGSLGLGLFICRRIIEAHGGRIGVDSTVGQGSTFWFELRAA
ncbi:MAG TPA: HAMP domain-containing sensor histidine kinase [Kofleriaceae bacterium]|nr:HAMP domain-containing sensor histidine kinase [Kofleriaceae bacterium]